MARLPSISAHAENDSLLVRAGLSICFYLRRSHVEIAQAVIRSLETYLRAIEPQSLGWYVDQEGDWRELDATGWAHIRGELHERRGLVVELSDDPSDASQYAFQYYGKALDTSSSVNMPDAVCAACFWLPRAYLEKHGPARVRALALELAASLPFNSGHASLAFSAELQLLGVAAGLRPWCFRYPGLDVPDLGSLSMSLGTGVRGAYWLTFLGQPVLGELGGTAGLRTLLSSPAISIQEMEGERAVVTLGEWPDAGDMEQGRDLPLHRELARVLEPWLHQRRIPWSGFAQEDMYRWERRFLD